MCRSCRSCCPRAVHYGVSQVWRGQQVKPKISTTRLRKPRAPYQGAGSFGNRFPKSADVGGRAGGAVGAAIHAQDATLTRRAEEARARVACRGQVFGLAGEADPRGDAAAQAPLIVPARAAIWMWAAGSCVGRCHVSRGWWHAVSRTAGKHEPSRVHKSNPFTHAVTSQDRRMARRPGRRRPPAGRPCARLCRPSR